MAATAAQHPHRRQSPGPCCDPHHARILLSLCSTALALAIVQKLPRHFPENPALIGAYFRNSSKLSDCSLLRISKIEFVLSLLLQWGLTNSAEAQQSDNLCDIFGCMHTEM